MVVLQGEVFWANLGRRRGSEPEGRRPVVVVQSDMFNRTRLRTVIAVALTTNKRLGDMPGNVRIRKGEANLPKSCVANVTQIETLDKASLEQKLGTLRQDRVTEILDGLELVLRGVR